MRYPPRVAPYFFVTIGMTQLFYSSWMNTCHGFSSISKGACVQGRSKSPISQVRLMVSSSSIYLENLGNGLSSQDAANRAYLSTTSISPTIPTSNFIQVPVLSLHHADSIADKVIECCKRNSFNPVCVYVLDSAGHALVFKRMDDCSPVGIPDFAHAKAFSCIVNKYPSRTFRDRYTADEASAKFGQMLGMVEITQGKMAPFPGGILLKAGDHLIGAVGVSGAAGDEDEYCAIRGVIESDLGLSTVPEHYSCSTVKDVL